jgi:hypothetical protein
MYRIVGSENFYCGFSDYVIKVMLQSIDETPKNTGDSSTNHHEP